MPDLDNETLNMLIRRFRAMIGEKLLRARDVSAKLIEVILGREDLRRETDGPQASYTDIVTVANLLNRVTAKVTAWQNVAALKKLHLHPDICPIFFEQFDDEIRAAHEMLFPH